MKKLVLVQKQGFVNIESADDTSDIEFIQLAQEQVYEFGDEAVDWCTDLDYIGVVDPLTMHIDPVELRRTNDTNTNRPAITQARDISSTD